MESCVISVETAPSFEQISQSITDLLTDSCHSAAANAGDTAAAKCSDEMVTSAALSTEYQQVSTWCWVNIRVCMLCCTTITRFYWARHSARNPDRFIISKILCMHPHAYLGF